MGGGWAYLPAVAGWAMGGSWHKGREARQALPPTLVALACGALVEAAIRDQVPELLLDVNGCRGGKSTWVSAKTRTSMG